MHRAKIRIVFLLFIAITLEEVLKGKEESPRRQKWIIAGLL